MTENQDKPKKKRKRIRESCPDKRNNYKKYAVAKWEWIDVLELVDKKKSEGIRSHITDVVKQYKITYRTLQRKYSEWVKNGKPKEIEDEENRGGHNKFFSEEEERKLYEYMKEVYVDNNLFFDDECLKIIAAKKWGLLFPEKEKDFIASNGWIYDFKIKWRLSTLTASCSKKATKDTSKHLEYFLKICAEIFIDYDPSLIFNTDETFWRILNGALNVIGITGSENRKLIMDVDFKAGFTAIFIISADGIFHKPTIILKGKTLKLYEKTQLTDDTIFNRKFTESGWLDKDIMISILIQINKITKGKECVLILDSWGFHKDPTIKELANALKIKLLYVPVGKTATNQPLDVAVNGVIKGIGKHIAREIFLNDAFSVPTIKDSIKALIESINKIKKTTIMDSFEKACTTKDNKYAEQYKKIKTNEKEKEMHKIIREAFASINCDEINDEFITDIEIL